MPNRNAADYEYLIGAVFNTMDGSFTDPSGTVHADSSIEAPYSVIDRDQWSGTASPGTLVILTKRANYGSLIVVEVSIA